MACNAPCPCLPQPFDSPLTPRQAPPRQRTGPREWRNRQAHAGRPCFTLGTRAADAAADGTGTRLPGPAHGPDPASLPRRHRRAGTLPLHGPPRRRVRDHPAAALRRHRGAHLRAGRGRGGAGHQAGPAHTAGSARCNLAAVHPHRRGVERLLPPAMRRDRRLARDIDPMRACRSVHTGPVAWQALSDRLCGTAIAPSEPLRRPVPDEDRSPSRPVSSGRCSIAQGRK